MLYLRTNYFLISDITKSYSLTYLDYISFSASKMKCKFSSLLLKPCEGSFWYRSQLQAACVTSDRWGTRRGAERGRGDTGRRLTTMDQAVVWRCFSPGCSSVDVEHLWRTLLPGNASLWWVHSSPAEQREPNQSTSKFPPPRFPAWFLTADIALLFYMHISVTFRDRRAHKNPFPPPCMQMCMRRGGLAFIFSSGLHHFSFRWICFLWHEVIVWNYTI